MPNRGEIMPRKSLNTIVFGPGDDFYGRDQREIVEMEKELKKWRTSPEGKKLLKETKKIKKELK